jgi:hypothetical protein
MRQLNIDSMKRYLIFIPYAMDPRRIRKILIPETFCTKGPVAGFDYRLRTRPGITKDQEDGRRRMFVKQRSISRWYVHIQYPYPSVVQDIMMSRFLADLYHFRSIYRKLGKTAAGNKKVDRY